METIIHQRCNHFHDASNDKTGSFSRSSLQWLRASSGSALSAIVSLPLLSAIFFPRIYLEKQMSRRRISATLSRHRLYLYDSYFSTRNRSCYTLSLCFFFLLLLNAVPSLERRASFDATETSREASETGTIKKNERKKREWNKETTRERWRG